MRCCLPAKASATSDAADLVVDDLWKTLFDSYRKAGGGIGASFYHVRAKRSSQMHLLKVIPKAVEVPIRRRKGIKWASVLIGSKSALQTRDITIPAETRFSKEARILKSLSHQNLATLQFTVEDLHNYAIALECPEKPKSLLTYVSQLPAESLNERTLSNLIGQIIQVLMFLHQNDVACCKVQPDSFIVDNRGIVKLIDLSNAMELLESKMDYPAVGSIPWKAPEMGLSVQNIMRDSDSLLKSDAFSLGIVCHLVLVGRLPLFDPFSHELVLHEEMGLSSSALSFLKALLTVEPAERATIEKIRYHPWILDPPQQVVPKQVQEDIKSYRLLDFFQKNLNYAAHNYEKRKSGKKQSAKLIGIFSTGSERNLIVSASQAEVKVEDLLKALDRWQYQEQKSNEEELLFVETALANEQSAAIYPEQQALLERTAETTAELAAIRKTVEQEIKKEASTGRDTLDVNVLFKVMEKTFPTGLPDSEAFFW